MKRLTPFLIPAAFAILASCQGGQRTPLEATVTLVHLPSSVKTAYLEEIRPLTAYIVDTATIDPLKGTFAFSFFPSGSEGLYRIQLDDSTSIFLALDNRDVAVRGDYQHPDSLEIRGSAASTELQQFLGALNRDNQRLSVLETRYQELQKAHTPDSVLRMHHERILDERQKLLDRILDEARTTTSPVNAVFALSILDNQGAWEEGKPIFDGLEQRFPGNALVKQAASAYDRQLNNEGKATAIGIGDVAPNIRYPDTAGKAVSLQDFRGKYVLLDFWASWCAPCRAENPNVVKAWKRFGGPSFAILGVSLDTKKSSWLEAIRQDRLSWSQISDLKGWNSAPAATYGVEAIPANFLINPEGKIVATNLEGDSLMLKLKQVLPGQ